MTDTVKEHLAAALRIVLNSDMAQREEDEGNVSKTLNVCRDVLAAYEAEQLKGDAVTRKDTDLVEIPKKEFSPRLEETSPTTNTITPDEVKEAAHSMNTLCEDFKSGKTIMFIKDQFMNGERIQMKKYEIIIRQIQTLIRAAERPDVEEVTVEEIMIKLNMGGRSIIFDRIQESYPNGLRIVKEKKP